MKLTHANLRNIINLAICAFGIQFATALQMANMTALYRFLGASSSHLSYLWLAAPVSGLLVQPLVGQLSDSTETRFGKRIPYIFFWGILTAIALFAMPFTDRVLLAAILLWILDCSINGCTETLRALTADIMANPQKATAFAAQSVFAGIGAGIAAIIPWLLDKKFDWGMVAVGNHYIPLTIRVAFIIGSVVLLLCIIYSIMLVKEKPFTRNKLLFLQKQKMKKSKMQIFTLFFKEITANVRHMPKVIKDFYWVQVFTWTGLFCLWLYFSLAIAQRYFHLPPGAHLHNQPYFAALLQHGTEWAGLCYGIYQFVSVIYAILLPKLAEKMGAKFIHAISLMIGALGIMSIGLFTQPKELIISMFGIGIMWGSIMTMPYAIVTAELPKSKVGIYLGIFNITITLPQIISGIFLGYITTKLFHHNAVDTLLLGGILILLSGILLLMQNYNYSLRKFSVQIFSRN